MTPLPVCCAPRAYSLLARQLPTLSSSDSLLSGAVAIARHHNDNADPQDVDAQIQSFADTVRSRVRGQQPQALLAHLHEFLFDKLGFRGNDEDYYNAANSYLPAVLETRRGLPITLSLIYKLVAERIGLRTWGVALPGHFMAAVLMDGSPMLIDTFAGGRLLSVEEADERLQVLFGAEIELNAPMLAPASNRHWLTRMLQNLLNVFGSNGQYADVAAMLELQILLWPEQTHLQRDLGFVLARCGMCEPASQCLDQYLKTNPDDPQEGKIRELLQVLGE